MTILVFAPVMQLLSKGWNTLLYFTQLPNHPSFSGSLKSLKSHMISMHIVSFQNNSIFYNRYFKCVEKEVFRIERIAFSRYYVVNLEKFKIVFNLSASNCMCAQEREIDCISEMTDCCSHSGRKCGTRIKDGWRFRDTCLGNLRKKARLSEINFHV